MSYEQIRQSCESVDLVVVSKNREASSVMEILSQGAEHIAENRVQEAKDKFPTLFDGGKFQSCKKHLIGHLQRNKASDAVELFDMIQSVDSLRLAQAISYEAKKQGKVIEILLQINISNDEAKFGIASEELKDFWTSIQPLLGQKHILARGLMTITERHDQLEDCKADFLKMKALFEDFNGYSNISNPILSMGMSSDYQLAIECGATMVRVGRAVFEN